MLLEELLEALEGQQKSRGDFIIKTYGPKWKGLGDFKTIEDFVEELAKVDPTRNGQYMQWLAKLAITRPDQNRVEDLDRVAGDLRAFEKFKAKLEVKDINQFKSFQDLFLAIEPFLAPKEKTAEEKKAEQEEAKLSKIKDEITIVYNGPEGWIRIPTTKKAAQFLGQSTRWCTSAKAKNMFDLYNASDSLFVIYDKETKKRSQLHIDSGQFADEKDTNHGLDAVPKWAWKPISDWYKKHNPNLSMKHLVALSAGSGENLAVGTDHEDLLNLMKSYGVV